MPDSEPGTVEEPHDVVVEVANDGPEISAEVKERLFEPFFTTKPVGQGTGMGLHLCQEIAVAHDGSIGLAEREGWVSFLVTMPRV